MELDLLDLADEDRMVPGGMLVHDPAFQVSQTALQYRYTVSASTEGERRLPLCVAPGKVHARLFLSFRQEIHDEPIAFAQDGKAPGLVVNAHEDHERFKGDGANGIGRQAVHRATLLIKGDHAHTAGEVTPGFEEYFLCHWLTHSLVAPCPAGECPSRSASRRPS